MAASSVPARLTVRSPSRAFSIGVGSSHCTSIRFESLTTAARQGRCPAPAVRQVAGRYSNDGGMSAGGSVAS